MRVGVTPTESDMLEVVGVEKGRGKVTGARVWRVTVRVPACYPPFVSGHLETVMVWPEERREVDATGLRAKGAARGAAGRRFAAG